MVVRGIRHYAWCSPWIDFSCNLRAGRECLLLGPGHSFPPRRYFSIVSEGTMVAVACKIIVETSRCSDGVPPRVESVPIWKLIMPSTIQRLFFLSHRSGYFALKICCTILVPFPIVAYLSYWVSVFTAWPTDKRTYRSAFCRSDGNRSSRLQYSQVRPDPHQYLSETDPTFSHDV